jgi:hypothetical protein
MRRSGPLGAFADDLEAQSGRRPERSDVLLDVLAAVEHCKREDGVVHVSRRHGGTPRTSFYHWRDMRGGLGGEPAGRKKL